MSFNNTFKNKVTYNLFTYKSHKKKIKRDLVLNNHEGWYVIKPLNNKQ